MDKKIFQLGTLYRNYSLVTADRNDGQLIYGQAEQVAAADNTCALLRHCRLQSGSQRLVQGELKIGYHGFVLGGGSKRQAFASACCCR